jgi:4-hydroxythreonine-4-phosphate dehydrogenase
MSAPPSDAHPSGTPLLPIAVTLGDPAGIGPDIILAAWRARQSRALCPFVVYGDPAALQNRARALGFVDVPIASFDALRIAAEAFPDTLPVVVTAGASATDVDAGIVSAIEVATAAVAGGEALALVTGPIAKKSLRAIPLEYPGHTALLGQLAARHNAGHTYRPVMMLVADELKVVPTTVHIPLSAVPGSLTRSLIAETIRITAAALAQDFGVPHPRIAVAGLNPHAGEGGLIGSEEGSIIAPAIADAAAEGVAVTGPHSADALFHGQARRHYDAVVAMYHDQALIPLKTLAFDRGVNVTLGLPFVRTSPDHGTAYALAGTGKARPESFIAALQLAAKLGHRRAAARAPAAR